VRAHDPPEEPSSKVSLRDAFGVWGYVALNSFGGPAGQIAVMHRVLVDGRHWISERRFLHALNYCMLLPGPEAHQLGVYIGWLLHGLRGGLLAGLLFILPGFLSILALSVLYAGYQETVLVSALFYGIKPAVIAVVAAAVVRVGRRALPNRSLAAIALGAFVAIFFLEVPFPLVVLAAALAGFLGSHLAPGRFTPGDVHPTTQAAGTANPAGTLAPATPARHLLGDGAAQQPRPPLRRTMAVLSVGLLLWLGPVLMLLALFGASDIFVQQGLFFSGAALVTFGGAYAVLAYVAQQAVETFGWLSPTEMLDGLGMAETTPGPLIMVVQFVGFLAAFRSPGALDPMVAGVLGAVLVTWVTFVPSFLWIFLGAPYLEYLRGKRALSGALTAITAAVVGVILNLALWFSLHTLFATVGQTRIGAVRLYTPDPSTLDPAALAIAGLAIIGIVVLRWSLLRTLALSAVAGALYYLTIVA
jgi:chromate transporter